MTNHEKIESDIMHLWKFPFDASFEQLLSNSSVLSKNQQAKIRKVYHFYLEQEESAAGTNYYHLHGLLSCAVMLYTFNNWGRDLDVNELLLIVAALFHDFKGIFDLLQKDIKPVDIEENRFLIKILGESLVQEMIGLFKYCEYDPGNPISWGQGIFGDNFDVVDIRPSVGLSGLLIAYADIVGQISSPSYPERRKELVRRLGIEEEEYTSQKIILLADYLIDRLEEDTGERIPKSIMSGYLSNTYSARQYYDI